VNTDIKQQLAIIKRGADELLIEAELLEKLKKGQPLRIKAGFDPTDIQYQSIKSLDKAAQLAMLPDCPIHTVDLTVGTVFPYSIAYWVILVI
jgi:hypothetical protein